MKLLFPLLLFVAMAGCCKEFCSGNEIILSFEKFRAVDTDTVYVVRYQPGTQWTKIIDTARLYSNVAAADTSRSRLFHTITGDFDWKIHLPSLNKSYTIADFSVTKKRCPCGGDTYRSIEAYKVNNVSREGFYLALD